MSVICTIVRATFVWPWNENMRIKEKQQTNGYRAIWLVYRTNTNTRGFWLVTRMLMWKNFMPKKFLRNKSILCFDIILQHDWPIEQCPLHNRAFFGGKTKSPCFDLLNYWLIKQNKKKTETIFQGHRKIALFYSFYHYKTKCSVIFLIHLLLPPHIHINSSED